jgi:hypothetical protein
MAGFQGGVCFIFAFCHHDFAYVTRRQNMMTRKVLSWFKTSILQKQRIRSVFKMF